MYIDHLKNKVKTPEFIITAASVLLGIISIIVYGVCSAMTENYFINAWVFVLAIFAIAVQAVCMLVKQVSDNQLIKNIAGIVATLLYAIALIVFVVSSVEWIQHLLSKDSVPAFDNSYIVAIIFFVLSLITQIVSVFFHKTEE